MGLSHRSHASFISAQSFYFTFFFSLIAVIFLILLFQIFGHKRKGKTNKPDLGGVKTSSQILIIKIHFIMRHCTRPVVYQYVPHGMYDAGLWKNPVPNVPSGDIYSVCKIIIVNDWRCEIGVPWFLKGSLFKGTFLMGIWKGKTLQKPLRFPIEQGVLKLSYSQEPLPVQKKKQQKTGARD